MRGEIGNERVALPAMTGVACLFLVPGLPISQRGVSGGPPDRSLVQMLHPVRTTAIASSLPDACDGRPFRIGVVASSNSCFTLPLKEGAATTDNVDVETPPAGSASCRQARSLFGIRYVNGSGLDRSVGGSTLADMPCNSTARW